MGRHDVHFRPGIIAAGALCVLVFAGGCTLPLPASAPGSQASAVSEQDRNQLEQSLAVTLEASRRDGSPTFSHNAEMDTRRLLTLDRNQNNYEKTMEHATSLAEILEKTGRIDEADMLRESLSKFKEATSERALGKGNLEKGDLAAASEHFTKAIDAMEHLDPALFSSYSKILMDTYTRLALVQQKMKHYQEAERLHRQIIGATIEAEGDDSAGAQATQFNLARFFAETGDEQRARVLLDGIIAKWPSKCDEARKLRAQLGAAP